MRGAETGLAEMEINRDLLEANFWPGNFRLALELPRVGASLLTLDVSNRLASPTYEQREQSRFDCEQFPLDFDIVIQIAARPPSTASFAP